LTAALGKKGVIEMGKRPGGEMTTRPLHFIWIVDCSGSMGVDGKIQSLNTAIREAIPHMQRVANENPNAACIYTSVKICCATSSPGCKTPFSLPKNL